MKIRERAEETLSRKSVRAVWYLIKDALRSSRPKAVSRITSLVKKKENLMFVREVTTLLKPNSISKFSLLMEEQIIPMLREQNRFQDELTFFDPSEDGVTGISLWDKASNAEAYSCETYPAVLKKLAALIEGTPNNLSQERDCASCSRV